MSLSALSLASASAAIKSVMVNMTVKTCVMRGIVLKIKSHLWKTTVNINAVMENVSLKVRCVIMNLNVMKEKRKKAVQN